MKRRISGTTFLMLVTLASGLAATFQLNWTPSPSTGVTGQKVYSSTNGVNWKLERTLGPTNVTTTISNASSSIRFFAVSATNAVGSESLKAEAEVLQAPGAVQIIELP